MKDVQFRGHSLADMKEFPQSARREAGFQIDRVQRGFEPCDWKPMTSVGAGVREIRITEGDPPHRIYRVFYVTKLGDVVYVLHCFQKTTQKTSLRDINIGKLRLQELKVELSHERNLQ
jgi:phage-related protein